MAKYIPSPRDWVREQVELYESSGGTKGTTLRDTGLPVIIVTHTGNKTGAIRKTPLMRVKDGDSYVLVGSQGGAPDDPVWVHNLRANPQIELRDETVHTPDARARGQGRGGAGPPVGAGRRGVSAVCRLSGTHPAANPGVCRGTLTCRIGHISPRSPAPRGRAPCRRESPARAPSRRPSAA